MIDELEKLANLEWKETNGGHIYMPINPDAVLKLIAVVREIQKLFDVECENGKFEINLKDLKKALKALEEK